MTIAHIYYIVRLIRRIRYEVRAVRWLWSYPELLAFYLFGLDRKSRRVVYEQNSAPAPER